MTNGIVSPDIGETLLEARMFSAKYVYSSKKKTKPRNQNIQQSLLR
ncbi:MAG TPA: hypothetical protein VEW92_03535 [Nitrososphaeraceae archaeon]|nr:hypothetical protein [Nitrososphaeraceae archaeon]